MAYAGFKKIQRRFILTFTPPCDVGLPRVDLKTYNKYLTSVICRGSTVAGGPLRQPHYDIRGIVGVSNLSTNNH